MPLIARLLQVLPEMIALTGSTSAVSPQLHGEGYAYSTFGITETMM